MRRTHNALALSALFGALVLTACDDRQNTTTEPAAEGPTLVGDVETLCDQVRAHYAYFEARSKHWDASCDSAIEKAEVLDGRAGSLAILEVLLDDLYDPHVSINTNNQSSPRLLPSGADIRVDQVEDSYIITGVRPKSGAAKSGVRVGDEVLSFNGLEPDSLAKTRMHSGLDAITKDRLIWAVNASIAGRRDQPRDLEVRRGDRTLAFSLGEPVPAGSNESVSRRLISEGIGYIRFNNRLGDTATVDAFEEALTEFRSTEGLILDLRGTPGGGGTNVAEPILGRFVQSKTPYQTTVYPGGRRNERRIRPRGRWTYDQPLVVLVGPWTGSMGEGMAIGFDGMNRGTVIGSPMAGLAGGADNGDQIYLSYTDVSIWIPTYDLHHVDGTPRHLWSPSETSISDNGDEEDLLLKRAVTLLNAK